MIGARAPARLRILFGVAALALLSACSGLETTKPLLAPADAAGAPALRPGLWLVLTKPDCALDETKPIAQWPECAGPALVRPGELRLRVETKPKVVWESMRFVLAAGDPRIGQAEAKEAASATNGHKASVSYLYGVAGPMRLDSRGRIVAATFWTVLCGPPPPIGTDGVQTASGTLQPLPGMLMKPGDAHCSTDSAAALRGAAKASLEWKDSPIVAHWVRDGDR